MQVTFEDNGSPLKKSKNSKGETCEEQLRRMCKDIAQEITDGLKIDDTSGTGTVTEWMEDVYDIRYLVDSRKEYMGAELLVAGGGPTIWVDTWRGQVKGWWGGDKVIENFADNLGLDNYCEEMYGS
tara:strand:- start:233 stop:610 length:378 start_codon:yes stop_codon:yes gene_type:complete